MTDARPLFDPVQFDRLSTATVPGYDAVQELVALAASATGAARVLDLGCGTGAGLLALARALPRATLVGSDPSEPMLSAARTRCSELGDRVHFHAGSVEQLSGEAAFDVIGCTLVLHFIPPPDRAAFLRATLQLLRPGGALVLTTLGPPPSPEARAVWDGARSTYAQQKGVAPEVLSARQQQTRGQLFPVSAPQLDQLLLDAGFGPPVPLFQLFAVHSWQATR